MQTTIVGEIHTPGLLMSGQSSVRLSVIIPAYNEEERLPETLRQALDYLASEPYSAEIIVVNDGSTDATEKLVRGWPRGPIPVRLLNHPMRSNRGKGASVRLGMLEGCGDFRLFMDADNSTTLDQVSRFWHSFGQGYDVVIGSRKMKGAQIAVRQHWVKELAGRLGNLVIRNLAVPNISDTQAGFKMFTRSSAEKIFPLLTIDRWGFDVEVLAIAAHLGYRIKEVPIRWINDRGSKVRTSAYFQVLAEVWRIRGNLKKGRYG
jgi:dolichyl-phosphate beta-glucosyltransferase